MVDLKKNGSSLEELLNSILYFYYLRNYGEFGLCMFFLKTNSATCCVRIMMIREGRSSFSSLTSWIQKSRPMVSSFNRSGKSTTLMVCWYTQCMKTRDVKVIVGRISRSMFFQRTIELSYVRFFLRRLWGLVSPSTHCSH